jgi:hypothetical protein
MEKIPALLEAIAAVVDEDHTPWAGKRDKVLEIIKNDSRLETAFEEFMSWFEEADAA